MSRPIRIEFSGAFYHVTARGDRRENIYDDDTDRERFLAILGQVIEDFNWVCHAYCLMSNHYHLLIETPDGSLSKGMCQLNGVFTQASNRRHQRSSHLFQGRYKAILVDAGKRNEAVQEYRQFVVQGIGQESIWRYLNRQVFLGDDHFVQQMQQKTIALSEDLNIPKAQRRPPAPPLEKLATAHASRNEAIVAMYATGEYSYSQIAAFFNIHFTTVDKIIREAKTNNGKNDG